MDAFAVEEGDLQCFDLGFYAQDSFFGRGEVGEHHAIDCCFDSRSNWSLVAPGLMFYGNN